MFFANSNEKRDTSLESILRRLKNVCDVLFYLFYIDSIFKDETF